VIRFQHKEMSQLLGQKAQEEAENWRQCVVIEMRKMKFRREDAQDRGLWKSGNLENRPTCASTESRTNVMLKR
jgi:hypothetical protein